MMAFDHDPIRAHVNMLHNLAAGCDGIIPLCVYGENPDSGRKTKIVQHFRVGDVDGMTAAAIAYESHPDANVYAPLTVMRRDLRRRQRGGNADIIAVLGGVIDSDADAGRTSPVPPNYVVQSSAVPAENRQEFILFDRPLPLVEAVPLLEALHHASGGDSGTKDTDHVWRIPGTANWPNKKKVHERNRPREPQLVRIIKPWDGSLTSVDDLRRVLAPYMNGDRPNGHARADDTEADWRLLWATLPEATKKLIASPPMPNEDRSATASVILSLIGRGWSDDKIAAVIAAHPEGIGARYAEGKNLEADIERLRQKSEAKPSNAAPDDFNVQIFNPWEQYVVPLFPFDVLPDSVRQFVETQSKVIGCDSSAMAMATLASLSAAIDHRSALKMLRNGDWYAHPRLWVLMVGDPSRKKTPALRAATKCLEDHEQALWDKWKAARDALKAEDPETEDPPKPPRFVVGDTTIEALAEILTRGDRGLLVKNEIAGWIGGMERYNSGNRGASADRAFWLQAYDGGPFTVDRIKRGEQRIKNLSVSLLGGIQPQRLQELRGLASDGLLQRFLPVMMSAAAFPR